MNAPDADRIHKELVGFPAGDWCRLTIWTLTPRPRRRTHDSAQGFDIKPFLDDESHGQGQRFRRYGKIVDRAVNTKLPIAPRKQQLNHKRSVVNTSPSAPRHRGGGTAVRPSDATSTSVISSLSAPPWANTMCFEFSSDPRHYRVLNLTTKSLFLEVRGTFPSERVSRKNFPLYPYLYRAARGLPRRPCTDRADCAACIRFEERAFGRVDDPLRTSPQRHRGTAPAPCRHQRPAGGAEQGKGSFKTRPLPGMTPNPRHPHGDIKHAGRMSHARVPPGDGACTARTTPVRFAAMHSSTMAMPSRTSEGSNPVATHGAA